MAPRSDGFPSWWLLGQTPGHPDSFQGYLSYEIQMMFDWAWTLPLQLEPEFMTPQEFMVDMEDDRSQVSVPTLVQRYCTDIHVVIWVAVSVP